jgi:hypothetical protein
MTPFAPHTRTLSSCGRGGVPEPMRAGGPPSGMPSPAALTDATATSYRCPGVSPVNRRLVAVVRRDVVPGSPLSRSRWWTTYPLIVSLYLPVGRVHARSRLSAPGGTVVSVGPGAVFGCTTTLTGPVRALVWPPRTVSTANSYVWPATTWFTRQLDAGISSGMRSQAWPSVTSRWWRR